ncbi:aromatic acid exporter family protein [Streptomyces sp. SID13726]|uniref:aromatic acid exporter family protein n=1 Tax=Streptomyces sp. SID13726 TaxID=2706058 RepID=UPI0013BA70E4|nr:aromatic acid exporter family protein [Streptomyces sp. SID13726]NEB02660.1 FUSC family protein [Streptomyces sp. SID13726]
MSRGTRTVRRRSRAAHALRQEAGAVGRAAGAAWRGPGRERDLVVQSLKASAAALLAWLVAGVWLGDPMALMAPWVAVVLMQATVYSSLMQAARQFGAICCGTLLASVALAVTGNTLGAVALSVPLLVLLANWPRFGDQGIHGATTALFTLATGAAGLSSAGHRMGQAALGAVIGVAVNAFVLPPIHLRDVRENLAALAREAGDVLHAVAGDLRDGAWDTPAWSAASARLEHRLEALRSARGWSRESLRLTAAPLRAVRRPPGPAPPERDDERWSRVTGHIRALTRTLAVAADADRAPVPPSDPVLEAYAGLLELVGDACRAESRRLLGSGDDALPDEAAEAAMRELRGRLQDGLREHAGQGAAGTAVLGTLLLQAENLWSETVPAGRNA